MSDDDNFARVSLSSQISDDDTQIILKMTSEDGEPITADLMLAVLKEYVLKCETEILGVLGDLEPEPTLREDIEVRDFLGSRIKIPWQ